MLKKSKIERLKKSREVYLKTSPAPSGRYESPHSFLYETKSSRRVTCIISGLKIFARQRKELSRHYQLKPKVEKCK